MDGSGDDDDVTFVKASAGLLSALEEELPKVLWKARQPRRAHSCVKKQDLSNIVSLIEPFQSEPQLLDAKLKTLLPPIVDAYLYYLATRTYKRDSEHLDLEAAVCTILYTLCKVRGYKIITGFFNNEPRFLEPVLEAIERHNSVIDPNDRQWQIPYVLMLWISHLLLTPFDLASISTAPAPVQMELLTLRDLPPLTHRILRIGLHYLGSPTKAQDAAAALIVRLSRRPDVQALCVADRFVEEHRLRLSHAASASQDIYPTLGSLRFLCGIVSSPELGHLIPSIYRTCEKFLDDRSSDRLLSNAVAKKMVIKIFRNIALLSLRSASAAGPLGDLLHNSDVVENVVDYLLQSLADKDTPVRFAAAKAISLIVLELEPQLGHEITQAILDSFKEDMPRSTRTLDFATADALKWHGLTLALSHILFKRSASPDQLSDILQALVCALQFQQRTTTGGTLGTNVRDAANFGVWSLSRRYTTVELLSVKAHAFDTSNQQENSGSIIQGLATQLILSACLDPAGNIRRGSSAALQELVGRHPDQIHEGIALVQVVDYQAVSLRRRAMIEVANKSAALHPKYWDALVDGLLGWRGLGSADVPSREDTARSIANLTCHAPGDSGMDVLRTVSLRLKDSSPQECEALHGLALSAAFILEGSHVSGQRQPSSILSQGWSGFKTLQTSLQNFSTRTLRSELAAAVAKYVTSLCEIAIRVSPPPKQIPIDSIDSVVESQLNRHEDYILINIPGLVQSLFRLKQSVGLPLTCIGPETLTQRVRIDSAKSTLHSAGRAVALGSLATHYGSSGLQGEQAATAVNTLALLMDATNVEWRIIGARALLHVANHLGHDNVDTEVVETVCAAMHQGLNDYTIDERGDIGSLVRLQSLTCTSEILDSLATVNRSLEQLPILKADIHRLSLEKLDRVRWEAAQLRVRQLDLKFSVVDINSVSSAKYFLAALEPLESGRVSEFDRALLEGCVSCAGLSGESLLQAARQALVDILDRTESRRLEMIMTMYSAVLGQFVVTPSSNVLPALELLGFLLDMRIPQRLSGSTDFKWRNLLSTVQKSHHKSNDVPKILAAVHVYIGLAQIEALRKEVLKKLISMMRTNPYPRIRSAVVEALWTITNDDELKSVDPNRPAAINKEVAATLSTRYTGAAT